MPTYLYCCVNKCCIGEFEEFHSISKKLEFCPHCEKDGRGQQPVNRLINSMSKGVVEQTVDELKASLPGEVRKIHQRAARDEAFLANLVGNKYQG